MRKPQHKLRRGWTTGACAAAAVKAALTNLWGGGFPDPVTITLPRGETPSFPLAHTAAGDGWAEAGITKDAGDDPDVTHGALVIARVSPAPVGVVFRAGEGVGTVTKPGLPIPPGEPAINPVPRQMMRQVVEDLAARYGKTADIVITLSIPGGAEIATRTWNPRLGIAGGLSILGTTGIVRPFSCAAWIASIHRGIDVARAEGLRHVAGCTGATSERAVQALHRLPDGAMLDMGDFVGGMLKYLARHPVPRITVGGGIAKMAKLAQGAMDLHSGRSRADFATLSGWVGRDLNGVNTVLEAHEIAGQKLADEIARRARARCVEVVPEADLDVVVVDRAGKLLAQAS